MDALDPSVLLDRSPSHTFSAHTGSLGIEFLEVGAGVGRMRGRTGYVPWPMLVAGVSLSAVPLQASYHGRTEWLLRTGDITLAEAFITFQGGIVYGFLCSTMPLKFSPQYQQLLQALRLLSRLIPETAAAYTWLAAHGDDNSLEIRAEGAVCGARVAYHDWDFRSGFTWSTPQAAIGYTSVSFAGTEPLRTLVNFARRTEAAIEQGAEYAEDFGKWVWRNVQEIF